VSFEISAPGWMQHSFNWRSHLTIVWIVLALYAVVDLVLLSLSRISIAPSTAPYLILTTLFGIVLAATLAAVRYRLRRLGVLGSQSPGFDRLVASAACGTELLILRALLMFALVVGMVTLSYLSASLSLPLRDSELAAIDWMLGFDWPAFLAVTNSHQWLVRLLRGAYHSSGPQLLVLFMVLSFIGRQQRLDEFIAVFALSSVATIVGMTLIPAEGAYAYYRPDPALFSNYGAISGMWHHETFTALRTQLAPTIDFANAQGLVTFPSFHTVLAIITCYGARDSRILFIPAVALNALVLVGTITEGGHHLIDLIAGGVIAVMAIALARRVHSGTPATLLTRHA
jgi:membrane-associated phospholipid phosphatase